MKNFLKIVSMTFAIAAVLPFASAQAHKAHKAKAVSCPVCHMALTRHKTKMNTVEVRLKKGGPIYYCCAACKMPASVLVKKPHKVMHRKSK